MARPWSEYSRAASGAAAAAAGLGARAIERALDALIPIGCLNCDTALPQGAAVDDFCRRCQERLSVLAGRLCDRCGVLLRDDPMCKEDVALADARRFICPGCRMDPPLFAAARGLYAYDGTGRELVLGLKRARRFRVAELVAAPLAEAGAALAGEADVIVPVPLSRRRRVARRFNQAALLGLALSSRTGLPCDATSLVRTRHTPYQTERGREAREENLLGAFAVRPPGRFAGRRVLLVDDVMTSGATINSCASVLLDEGAEAIFALVLARRLMFRAPPVVLLPEREVRGAPGFAKGTAVRNASDDTDGTSGTDGTGGTGKRTQGRARAGWRQGGGER